jgi:mRNA-degrading endonuclease RelE of RelBE toxin-antitoxin system
MQFTFSESAAKDVKKLPVAAQRNLKAKLLYWQAQTDPLHFAKPLIRHKEATHRFRIGVYRVLVKVVGGELRILRIRHRKDVYR